MLVKIVEVNVENVNKGNKSYSTMTVIYKVNGEVRTQKIMSFANPESFKILKDATSGQEFEVTVTKNDQGYNQWAKVEVPGASSAGTAASPTGNKFVSDRETPDERRTRQLQIVRQSSISNAIATLTPGSKAALNPDDVLTVAQAYVDFVYGNEEVLAADSADNKDIPY